MGKKIGIADFARFFGTGGMSYTLIKSGKIFFGIRNRDIKNNRSININLFDDNGAFGVDRGVG